MGWDLVVGFAFGVVIATVTAPVGVSGAVFLLPVQLSVLNVPSPSVTPTNLLYNLVAVPGALARYRRSGGLRSSLARLLLTGGRSLAWSWVRSSGSTCCPGAHCSGSWSPCSCSHSGSGSSSAAGRRMNAVSGSGRGR
jgi:hypothetical protein